MAYPIPPTGGKKTPKRKFSASIAGTKKPIKVKSVGKKMTPAEMAAQSKLPRTGRGGKGAVTPFTLTKEFQDWVAKERRVTGARRQNTIRDFQMRPSKPRSSSAIMPKNARPKIAKGTARKQVRKTY